MIEQTLVLLKPDAVQRGLVGEIIRRFEISGMKIVGLKMVHASEEHAGRHYADDKEWLESVGAKSLESYKKKGIVVNESPIALGKRVRKRLIDFLISTPILAIVLEGHNAVVHTRKMVGVTAPSDAMPGTIRGDFSFDTYTLSDASNRPIQNLVHASDSIETAKREIAVWFRPEELFEWKRADEHILYKK